MVKLVGWEEGVDAGPVKYHLQHWQIAEPCDDPGGVLYDEGYYVQCSRDCNTPQVCTSCALSCCWWESSGIVDLSTSVWVGQLCQVNFIGDTVDTREFACVDLPLAELDMLWWQLTDNVDDMTDQCTIAQISSGHSAQASVLCPGTTWVVLSQVDSC